MEFSEPISESEESSGSIILGRSAFQKWSPYFKQKIGGSRSFLDNSFGFPNITLGKDTICLAQ